jgi:hypothetical protein
VEQLLDPAEGAKPAANPASEENAVKSQNPAYIEEGASSGTERALECTQRTGPYRTGTGVAVEPRCAKYFAVAPVDSACNETTEIHIE